jgi:hypothetical protein
MRGRRGNEATHTVALREKLDPLWRGGWISGETQGHLKEGFIVTERELLDHSMRELEIQVKKHRQLIESVSENRPLVNDCPWNECCLEGNERGRESRSGRDYSEVK